MAARDRSQEPPLGVGRAVLLAWIVATALALVQLHDANPYFKIVGTTALTIAAIGIICFVRDRIIHSRRIARGAPSTSRTAARRSPDQPPDPLAGLRLHSSRAADHVQLALDLFDGRLREQLDGSQIRAARTAIHTSLAELATLDKAAASARTALDDLQRSLKRSDIAQNSDPDWRGLRDRLAEINGRQARIVEDLERASETLMAAWEPVEQEMLRHLHADELADARDQAESAASAVDASTAVSTDASARLSDAVDDIQARLRGVGEISSINDRILGTADFPGGRPHHPRGRKGRS